MKKQFIEFKQKDLTTREQAIQQMPWAFRVVGVEGGYMGFESQDEFYNHFSNKQGK